MHTLCIIYSALFYIVNIAVAWLSTPCYHPRMTDRSPPMTPEQAAIMEHSEEIYLLRQRCAVLEAAIRSLVEDIRFLRNNR